MTTSDDLALLEELLLARGPGGQEDEVRAICKRELQAICQEIRTDPAGNLVGVLRSSLGQRDEAERSAVRLMAHMDEIAMVVKRIDDDGSLQVVALGGAHPVNFGVCPVDILGERDVLPGVLSFGTMHGSGQTSQGSDVLSGNVQWQDVHVTTRRSVEELAGCGVRPGTRVVFSRHWRRPLEVNDAVAAHFLDDRAPIVALLKAARLIAPRLDELGMDVYFVFTTMEEETNAGALYASQRLPGETTIAVEVGPVTAEYGTRLCIDPIVITGDEKGYYSKSVADDLLHAAQRCGLAPQPALTVGFASDASAVLGTGVSARAGCIAIPTENTHGYELILKDGIDACARTLAEYLLYPHQTP